MKKEIYICDCCGREFPNEEELFTFQFLNNANKDIRKFFSRKEKVTKFNIFNSSWDICVDCIIEIQNKINKKNKIEVEIRPSAEDVLISKKIKKLTIK